MRIGCDLQGVQVNWQGHTKGVSDYKITQVECPAHAIVATKDWGVHELQIYSNHARDAFIFDIPYILKIACCPGGQTNYCAKFDGVFLVEVPYPLILIYTLLLAIESRHSAHIANCLLSIQICSCILTSFNHFQSFSVTACMTVLCPTQFWRNWGVLEPNPIWRLVLLLWKVEVEQQVYAGQMVQKAFPLIPTTSLESRNVLARYASQDKDKQCIGAVQSW